MGNKKIPFEACVCVKMDQKEKENCSKMRFKKRFVKQLNYKTLQ